ncbi:hypothetical protein EfmAA94_25630 [Enterococcus faecium]|nr:hypothetical protein EfmAA94_25630 [Enterococcus faecium]
MFVTPAAFLTGLRYGELISLTESDYDGNKITVSGTYDYELKIKTTTKNTGSYRSKEIKTATLYFFACRKINFIR